MRILVVEDEERLSEVLRRGLVEHGYAVDISSDGHGGLQMARASNYDAIILDIMLSGMNGYRVCAALRGEDISTPILMLTAKAGEYRTCLHPRQGQGRRRRSGLRDTTRPPPNPRGRPQTSAPVAEWIGWSEWERVAEVRHA